MAGPHDRRPGDGAGGRPGFDRQEGEAGNEPRARPEDDIEAVRGRMTGLVRRTCPHWLSDHAEDIVQTALARVLDQQRKTGENAPSSASYFMKAAYNATVDEIRRKFRHMEIPEGQMQTLDLAPGKSPDPETKAHAREIHRGIRDCLSGLSGPRRTAVTLHLLGYSLLETAESFGWTRKRAEHLIYRGLGDLRRCLTAKGLQP